MEKQGFIYIIGNDRNSVLYIGVTTNLPKRIWEHKNNINEGFARRYNCKQLYYYEVFENIYEAITREKRLKSWKREWKIKLIEEKNPYWKDLYPEIISDL